MPKVVFHVRESGELVQETSGKAYTDLVDAKREAENALREMVAEDVKSGRPLGERSIELTGENGELFGNITICAAVEVKQVFGKPSTIEGELIVLPGGPTCASAHATVGRSGSARGITKPVAGADSECTGGDMLIVNEQTVKLVGHIAGVVFGVLDKANIASLPQLASLLEDSAYNEADVSVKSVLNRITEALQQDRVPGSNVVQRSHTFQDLNAGIGQDANR